MRYNLCFLAITGAVTLAACGETPNQQAIAGGAAGAGTAILLDGNVLAGAAVGAAGNLLYCQNNPGQCN